MERERPKMGTTFGDAPQMYDAVFGYRNIAREVDFLEALYAQHIGGPIESVLDVACGTGAHAVELARRGYRVTGIDNCESTLDWAQQKAAREHLEIDFRLLDMANFHIEDTYSCAICMLQSLPYLTTNHELMQHFLCVSRALGERGLYLVELGNPRTWLHDPARTRHERWEAGSWIETRDGMRIRATCYRDPVNTLEETTKMDIVVDITGRGTSRRITDTLRQRLLLPRGLQALAAAGGRFRLAGYYGDFTMDQPFDESPRSWRMIGAFVRKVRLAKRRDEPTEQTTLEC